MDAQVYQSLFELKDSHFWLLAKRGIAESLLRRRIKPGGEVILDIGCGTGGNALFLSRWGQVTAADISPVALGFCRQQGLRRLCQASATGLPFADASFTLVTVFEVLYHQGVDDDQEALREFHRVLKQGGLLFVIEPALPFLTSEHDVTWQTRQRYTLGELKSKLNQAGFQVVKASYANALLFPGVAITRLWHRVLHTKSMGHSDLQPMSAPVNKAVLAVCRLEALLLRRVSFPVGSSVVCVAKKGNE